MRKTSKAKERLTEADKAPEKSTRDRRVRDRNIPAGRMTFSQENVMDKREHPVNK